MLYICIYYIYDMSDFELSGEKKNGEIYLYDYKLLWAFLSINIKIFIKQEQQFINASFYLYFETILKAIKTKFTIFQTCF